MSYEWYYVKENESIGPISEGDFFKLFANGTLTSQSYVWHEGMDNWILAKDCSDLTKALEKKTVPEMPKPNKVPKIEDDTQESYVLPDIDGGLTFDWKVVKSDAKIFSIKTGYDRKIADQKEYGPFSLSMLKRLFEEKRINGRTLIFTPGFETWQFLADIPMYQELFNDMPPIIDESERRINRRKPFVARILFVDKSEVFEGICRDISIGGLQMIVAECPVKVGEQVTMNVHPDNSDYSFTAKGEVVRILEGGHGFSVKFKGLDDQSKEAIQRYLNCEE